MERSRIGGGTNLFKRISRLDVNLIFDPYAVDAKGKTINQYYWDTHKKPLRLSMPVFGSPPISPLARSGS
ncbi:MAG: hypothetical protein IPJ06_04715 [Saprospiraceae bacterium]|nr:hypothetical protein [Saprospiraceae bacterium]